MLVIQSKVECKRIELPRQPAGASRDVRMEQEGDVPCTWGTPGLGLVQPRGETQPSLGISIACTQLSQ